MDPPGTGAKRGEGHRSGFSYATDGEGPAGDVRALVFLGGLDGRQKIADFFGRTVPNHFAYV